VNAGNEDERARRFVERHFPETTRFLAEENGGDPVPIFGPTGAIPCDEGYEPFAAVRMDLVVTREQLRAALAIGHAEMAGEPPLDNMNVRDVRQEVEGHLGVCAISRLDEEAGSINARLSPELAAQLDAAIDRAYTVREIVREEQRPYSYSDGTVMLRTLDRGEVLIAEPEWCKGHDGDTVGTLAEISHEGADTVVDVDSTDLGDVRLLSAHLTQAPYLDERPEPHPLMYVEGMEAAAYDSQRLRLLAARLVVFAGRLRDEARRLEEFEQGGQS
jgi:hypothetical protein